jgi:hypothetical protein
MIKRTLLLLLFGYVAWGQNVELENKLKKHFENIPVLQSVDSILRFVQADTSIYKTRTYRNSVTSTIIEFDINVYHYGKDTSENHIYYRDNSQGSFIGIKMSTKTTLRAKKYYKTLKHEYSNFFLKTTSERKRNKLMGGRSKTTSFYLGKNDKYPFIAIGWSSAADLFGNGYYIDIIKTVR